MIVEWHIFPVITGLMVTTIPERHDYAQQAVKDFLAQVWPHKNLVIVNATRLPFSTGKGVTEINAANASDSLWAFGLSQCQGEWVADWQDDCRYSPRYLHALARLRSRTKRVSLMAYAGVCISDGTRVNVENDGQAFNLFFRFAPVFTDEPTWLDKRELVTRYYASQAFVQA